MYEFIKELNRIFWAVCILFLIIGMLIGFAVKTFAARQFDPAVNVVVDGELCYIYPNADQDGILVSSVKP